MDVRKGPETDEHAVNFMLAEYTVMENLRQTAVSLGDSRLNFFLATMSGALVGLGLLFQVNGHNDLIMMVSGFIVVGLLVVGLTTFARVVERSLRIVVYTRGMNRIRRYFLERNPGVAQYLTESISDASPPFRAIGDLDKGLGYIGDPGIVAIFNSIIAGAASCALLNLIFGWLILSTLFIALVVTVGVFIVQRIYFRLRVKQMTKATEVRFPENK